MLTLFPQHVAKRYCKDWAAWGGEAALRGLNGLCRRSKEDRARKTQFVGSQLNDLEEETRKLADRVTAVLVKMRRAHEWLPYMVQAYVQQGLGEEPVQRYQRKENLQFTGTRWMHPCNVLEWKQIHWMKMRCVCFTEMMKREVDGRARTEKGTRREAKWKLRMRQDRSLRSRVVQFTNGVCCSRWCKNLS